jgi:hypothetical protein
MRLQLSPDRSPIVPETVARYAYDDQITIESTSFALNLGVGLTTFIPFTDPHHPDPVMGTLGMAIDFRVGYLVHFAHQDWKEQKGDEQWIAGLPVVDLSGIYSRLEFGFAGAEERYPACSAVCPIAPPHAEASCHHTRCYMVCLSGYGDCDGSPSNGCERLLDSNADCGACGLRCEPSHALGTCATGGCQIAQCDVGFMNCDGDASNGCETDVSKSHIHCGRCGQVCAPSESCDAGHCR